MQSMKGTCFGQHAAVLQLSIAGLHKRLLSLGSLDVLISAAHQAKSQYLCLPELHRTGISEVNHSFSCMSFPLLAV